MTILTLEDVLKNKYYTYIIYPIIMFTVHATL